MNKPDDQEFEYNHQSRLALMMYQLGVAEGTLFQNKLAGINVGETYWIADDIVTEFERIEGEATEVEVKHMIETKIQEFLEAKIEEFMHRFGKIETEKTQNEENNGQEHDNKTNQMGI